jgi:hypothetical protein
MSERRRHTKAVKELSDTKILVDFLLAHGLSFDDENNFTDQSVSRAKRWWKDLNDQFDEKLG